MSNMNGWEIVWPKRTGATTVRTIDGIIEVRSDEGLGSFTIDPQEAIKFGKTLIEHGTAILNTRASQRHCAGASAPETPASDGAPAGENPAARSILTKTFRGGESDE